MTIVLNLYVLPKKRLQLTYEDPKKGHREGATPFDSYGALNELWEVMSSAKITNDILIEFHDGNQGSFNNANVS